MFTDVSVTRLRLARNHHLRLIRIFPQTG